MKINWFNSIHYGEPTEPPIEWNSQPPSDNFKSHTHPTKNSPEFSDLMVRLNHHEVENGDAEVYTSYYELESTSESVSVPYKNPIK